MDIIFGPVPSRRLGRSLGINNIPPKWCSYACVYCQIGNTIKLREARREFYKSDVIFKSVKDKLDYLTDQNESVDYLAFVPDGEPALDINLGKHIKALKRLNTPIAVITNASLINNPSVQDDLLLADWISLKIDTVNEVVWNKINRPHGRLNLTEILEGMLIFHEKFKGKLMSETMLIKGLNDSEEDAQQLGNFLKHLSPDIAYLSIPTRPPAEMSIESADPVSVNRAWQIISEKIKRVELLTGYEGNTFSATGNLRKDILSITSVHPMREDAVTHMLSRYGKDRRFIDQMIKNEELIKSSYKEHTFYLRKF
jgi:wyosine [tRNA(Phe)-imidazoG37] synthetase (radical SAM superfamily)